MISIITLTIWIKGSIWRHIFWLLISTVFYIVSSTRDCCMFGFLVCMGFDSMTFGFANEWEMKRLCPTKEGEKNFVRYKCKSTSTLALRVGKMVCPCAIARLLGSTTHLISEQISLVGYKFRGFASDLIYWEHNNKWGLGRVMCTYSYPYLAKIERLFPIYSWHKWSIKKIVEKRIIATTNDTIKEAKKNNNK